MPNSVVLSSAIIPLREPSAVDLRARLRTGHGPGDVQALLDSLSTPMRGPPHVELEQVDREEAVVRIEATPTSDADGARLADEILERLEGLTTETDNGRRPEEGTPSAAHATAHATSRREQPRPPPARAGRAIPSRDGVAPAPPAPTDTHSAAAHAVAPRRLQPLVQPAVVLAGKRPPPAARRLAGLDPTGLAPGAGLLRPCTPAGPPRGEPAGRLHVATAERSFGLRVLLHPPHGLAGRGVPPRR